MAKFYCFRLALLLLLLVGRTESRGRFEPKILMPTEEAKSTEQEDTIGARWAVLIAGSSGYGNYRHQVHKCSNIIDLKSSYCLTNQSYYSLLSPSRIFFFSDLRIFIRHAKFSLYSNFIKNEYFEQTVKRTYVVNLSIFETNSALSHV